MIKRPKIEEIESIASLHLSSLKEGILYTLGQNVLKLFYKEIFHDKGCFILAYYISNKLVGVAASSEDSKIFFNKVKRGHFFKIALSVLVKSIEYPTLPFKLIFSAHQDIKSELMFLFVDGGYRGKKIGEKLIHSTSKEFKRRGVNEYNITILSANVRGKKFYERLGFEKIKQYSSLWEKRDLYKYVIK